ncbi:hypothetical protein GDO81_017523 [Engystomops pustulosus]|uniref:Uncharacterized protein n=1 Tax=Engystomops pustulosus TaxID=76066 RepID=A0AAV7AKK9_ENGPU|nr:hypothetical protein GDO81_017523 [Engystomops pustulosus]
MKQMMADGPRCKRRKQANPRRKNGGLILHIDRDEQDLSLLPERHPNICRRKDSRNSRSFFLVYCCLDFLCTIAFCYDMSFLNVCLGYHNCFKSFCN